MTESCRDEGQLDGMHGERMGLQAELLQGLGLRERAVWQDAARPNGGATKQLSLRSPLADCEGTLGRVGREQWYPPPDHASALDRGGRRSLERETLPPLMAAGECQARPSRQPSHPRQVPILPHHQQKSPWHSVDLAPLSRVAAADTATRSPADVPIATVPLERRPVEEPVMVPSSSSSLLGREPAAAAVSSRYADFGGSGAAAGGPGRVHGHSDEPRRGSQSLSQWTSYPGAVPCLSGGRTHGAEGSLAEHRASSMLGGTSGARSDGTHRSGNVGDAGASPVEWRPHEHQQQQQAGDTTYNQRSSSASVPTRAKRVRVGGGVAGIDEMLAPSSPDGGNGNQHSHPSPAATRALLPASGGGERTRDAEMLSSTSAQPPPLSPLLQEKRPERTPAFEASLGGVARDPCWPPRTTSSCFAAGAPFSQTNQIPPLSSWDLGSGRGSRDDGGGGGRSSQQGGGGLASSVGPGGGWWQGTGDRSCGGAVVHTSREFYGEHRLPRGSASRDRHPSCSSRPQARQQQDRHEQLPSMLPLAADTIIKPPVFSRGFSDPGLCGTTVRSLAAVIDTVHPSFSLAGPADATTTAGDLASGIRNSTTLGAPHGASGLRRGDCGEGDFDYGATTAAAEWVHRGSRRLSIGKGCMADGCDRRPRYGFRDSKKPAYCAKHRLVGMIDTRHPVCKDEQCTRQPSFGLEGDRRATYCARHRKAGMVNVTSRRCTMPGCARHPNFGCPGDRRASYCREHREMGMVDVVSRRCRDPSCMRRPLYNMDGLRPVWCSRHKLSGMIDVVSARCEEPGCLSHPSFGYASDKKARRCAKHRLENMVGVKGRRRKPPSAVVEVPGAADPTCAAYTTTSTTSNPSSSSTSPPHPR